MGFRMEIYLTKKYKSELVTWKKSFNVDLSWDKFFSNYRIFYGVFKLLMLYYNWIEKKIKLNMSYVLLVVDL